VDSDDLTVLGRCGGDHRLEEMSRHACDVVEGALKSVAVDLA